MVYSSVLPVAAFILALTGSCASQHGLPQSYVVPKPTVQALAPRGLRVSIPDEDGITLFAFHGSVNQEVPLRQAGTYNVDVTQKSGGRWTYEDRRLRLKPGDVVYYWLYVIYDDLGYHRPGNFTVREFVDPDSSGSGCVRSSTSVNGKLACRNELMFLENFDELDTQRWVHDVRVSGDPDYEFVIYSAASGNSYATNGQLVIRPTLTEDSYGADFVRTGNLVLDGCTGSATTSDQCSRQAKFGYILPPVLSARLSTRKAFSFRYGRIEIRAKLPRGDWIYPELWLLPREQAYGTGLQSGRIQIALSRGNDRLRFNGEEIGTRRLESGVFARYEEDDQNRRSIISNKTLSRTELPGRSWSAGFHNYTLLWTPEAMAFSVDDVEIGVLYPEPSGGFLHDNPNGDAWRQGGPMAPFDREFYVSLGVGVGGIRNFPDDVDGSGSSSKPWKNTAAKAMLSFWNAKEQWYPTWSSDSLFLIDSIRITAL